MLRTQLKKYSGTCDSQRFFKKGGSDQFIGIKVPILRQLAKEHPNLCVEDFLKSPINEERLLALITLVSRYKKGSPAVKEEIYQFYLQNLPYVNNWNLVDSSAHLIIGAHLYDKNKNILLQLVKSKVIWERRVAIVATWFFIKKGDFEWTIKLAQMLLDDKEDLIHKASGWMLREIMQKGGILVLEEFLKQNAATMPRTMLRYAIEKFDPETRQKYMQMKKN